MRLNTMLIGLMTVIALLGCAATEERQPKKQQDYSDLKRVSAISVASPNFEVEPGSQLAWKMDVIWLKADDIELATHPLNQVQVQRVIVSRLVHRGFKMVASEDDADYVIVAAVVLGDSSAGAAVEELARIYPELGQASHQMERGTIMLGLSKPGTNKVVWRAGIQAMMADDLPQQQRKQRLAMLIDNLLHTIPMAEVSDQ